MKIYVATSWKNAHQPIIVGILRDRGHTVYDFRHPPKRTGFSWSDVDPNWKHWDHGQFKAGLTHPVAVAGFQSDWDALLTCDALVCVLPCGRSAHLELGVAIGMRKATAILQYDERNTDQHSMSARACGACGDLDGCHVPRAPSITPELMYLGADYLSNSIGDVAEWLDAVRRARGLK